MDRYLQILRISWVSALVIAIFATVLTVVVRLFLGQEDTSNNNGMIYSTIVVMVVIALLLFGNKYGKKQIKKLKNKDLIEKITKYKSVYMNQLMCYVLISIVCFVVMILSRNFVIIIFDVFTVLLIIVNRPTQIKVKFDLNLTTEELSKFNHIKFYTKK